MDKIISFTDYDLFAYFMVGLAAFATSDIVLGTRFLFRDKGRWNFGTMVLIVIGAYVGGQIIATPAEWLLERALVGQVIGRPTDFLVADPSEQRSIMRRYVGSVVLFDYYKPLEGKPAQDVKSKTKSQGQALFWEAYPVAMKNDRAYERMSIFLKLYGFCRNMSFVAFLAAIGVAVQWSLGRARARTDALVEQGIQKWFAEPLGQFLVFLVVGSALFIRYLFFYRLFSVEVLIAFATP